MHNSRGDAPLFQGNLPLQFRGRAVSATTGDDDTLGRVVQRILVANYGRLKGGAKILARDAKGTPRAAENWLDGSCTPNAESLVNVMKRCRELRQAIFEMASEEDP